MLPREAAPPHPLAGRIAQGLMAGFDVDQGEGEADEAGIAARAPPSPSALLPGRRVASAKASLEWRPSVRRLLGLAASDRILVSYSVASLGS